MRPVFVLFLLLFNTIRLFSQPPVYPKDGTVKFVFFEGAISDTNQLKLTIKYTNHEKVTIFIPVNLVEGDSFDLYANIYTELQKFEGGKYSRFVDKNVDYFFGDSIPDIKKVYAKLNPGDSAVLNFNLISRIGVFYKGKYRMRVHLVKIPINDPPYAPAEYTLSRWFYFRVLKDFNYHDVYSP
jgi:hypothetical protein